MAKITQTAGRNAPGEETSNEWLEPVGDEEYSKLR